MTESQIKAGVVVRHKTKPECVETIQFIGKTKINGEWQTSVTYLGNDRNTGQPTFFTRTLDDFMANFEPYISE